MFLVSFVKVHRNCRFILELSSKSEGASYCCTKCFKHFGRILTSDVVELFHLGERTSMSRFYHFSVDLDFAHSKHFVHRMKSFGFHIIFEDDMLRNYRFPVRYI
jgi:hypothetical protein